MPTIKTGIRFSKKQPLSEQELRQLHAYWRAANYLTACQLYLMDNPLLERPLVKSDLKQTIVGHWGTCPGQNFIYTHLDRVIKRNDLDMIYLSGPGHGGNAMVAQDWLDGSYTEVYPNITRDKEGMQKLFKRFSFPGGIPSHVAPETPGSIHEGGELGYSLAHAFGAVADNPDLIAACVVGDGEAETGPLATSWHGNKFVNPITDGAVLPILHLNGFKIANPTIFSRMSHEEVECFFRGCGWEPYFVEGDDPMVMHQQMAAALDAWLENTPDQEILVSLYDEYIGGASYEDNMQAFGKVSYDAPDSISIYTDSFENKEAVADCIENYNATVDEDSRITYTDYVALLTGSITSIVDMISYVLIAFVGVSLIVSSIMIGIITHISVLERTKEIGILRAIGASKGNIAQVFNAETLIIGLLAGAIGVGVSALLTLPINSLMRQLLGAETLTTSLPLGAALILVALSMAITLIAGLVPARSAAKKDPVAALRSE